MAMHSGREEMIRFVLSSVVVIPHFLSYLGSALNNLESFVEDFGQYCVISEI